MISNRSGRPREFDRDAALRTAMEMFWQRGYEGTTLDELTATMGIGRSSFYAGFGSKHAVMLEVLELYTGELFARMETAAREAASPHGAVLDVLEIVACTVKPEYGCLFVNAMTELAPADPEVVELGRRYLSKVDRLVCGLLRLVGFTATESRKRSGAMLALSTGAITLRKAGEPPERIRAMLKQLPMLMG